jgi:hypothetical protein
MVSSELRAMSHTLPLRAIVLTHELSAISYQLSAWDIEPVRVTRRSLIIPRSLLMTTDAHSRKWWIASIIGILAIARLMNDGEDSDY